MIFISILILAATAIAVAAAYFSVYGLAATFSGTFWSVVVMGSSLELGKLVTASYLYRYWNKTNWLLKTYLIAGVFALMVLTSTGIFGYLSAGYQAESLPTKQIQHQVDLLSNEKTRLIDRKKQIDNQIANLPTDYAKSRVKLMNEFKAEQTQVTNRINELDKQELDLQSKLIQSEAHVGPITYITKAFGLGVDDGAKYLILLIIFVFDPMAVSLTLAVNNALRIRKEEKEQEQQTKDKIVDNDVSTVYTFSPDDEVWIQDEVVEKPSITEPIAHEPDPTEVEEHMQEELEKVQDEPITPIEPPTRRIRPYGGVTANVPGDQLLHQFNYYKNKQQQEGLTQDELWSLQAVTTALQKKGYNVYI